MSNATLKPPRPRARPQQGQADPSPRANVWEGWSAINWASTIWIVLLHVGAVAALFHFSWIGLGLFFLLHWMTASLGICLSFHRQLTHGSFKSSRPVKYFFAVLGSLAGEGPVLYWVATHRKHHAFSDQEGDPHSPRDGAWWSHIFWLLRGHTTSESQALLQRWIPDLTKDRGLQIINALFLPLNFALGGMLFAIGWAFWGPATGVSLVLWGVFARLVFVLHTTWLVNSATHIWGYRNYETRDDSRNLWWVGLLAYGEGWHNNHHAHPRLAAHGHKWWEFDMTWQAIHLMERVGLVWDVARPERREASKAA
jgi:stearoyl-CoA desaturase (delta-9 desaturase)